MLARQLAALARLRRGPAVGNALQNSYSSSCGHSHHDHGHGHGHTHGTASGGAAPVSDATVVLTNGGVGSTALLAYWKHWSHGQKILPLHVSFAAGSPAEQAALSVCRHLSLELTVLNASTLAGQLTQGSKVGGVQCWARERSRSFGATPVP